MRQTLNASGAVLGSVAYDPWGQVQSGSVPTFGFTGELQQGSNVYLRARWYNTSRGVFSSRDPFMGMPEQPYSLHPYAYVLSNPINLTDPTGWYYLCQDESQEYQQFCTQQRQLLLQMSININPQTLTDSLRGLLFMFANTGRAGDMPGGSGSLARKHRRPGYTAAQERLDFVLWATENRVKDEKGNPTESLVGRPTHFEIAFNDTGFAKELQDGSIWSSSGNQVGHFLTAVHIAYDQQGSLPLEARFIPHAAAACIVGHELIGDSFPGGDGYQCGAGLTSYHDGKTDIARFYEAVQFDRLGAFDSRNCLVQEIVGLPEQFKPNKFLTYTREGNSLQDMRLSIKGWILGEDIRDRRLTEPDEVRLWMITNLRG